MAFWFRGSQRQEGDTVITRREEDAIHDEVLHRRTVSLIVAPRQSGKTTLLKSLKARFDDRGMPAAYITLEGYDPEDSDEEIFRQLAQDAFSQFSEEVPERLSQRPKTFFDDRSLDGRVLLFDEFHTVATTHGMFLLKLRAAKEEKNRGLRVIVADRTDESAYARTECSPFNIARTFYLDDFNDDECYQIWDDGLQAAGFSPMVLSSSVAKYAYDWHAGQPYLVQRMGALVAEKLRTTGREEAEDVVVQLVASDLSRSGSDPNLTTLIRHAKGLGIGEKRLLRRVLEGDRPAFHSTMGPAGTLFTYGFIRPSRFESWDIGGFCLIRNRIYETVLKRHGDAWDY